MFATCFKQSSFIVSLRKKECTYHVQSLTARVLKMMNIQGFVIMYWHKAPAVTKHNSNKNEHHVSRDNRRQSSAMTCNSCPDSLLFPVSRHVKKKKKASISLLQRKQQSLLHRHK